MFMHRRYLCLGLLTVGLCAVIASSFSTHIGITDPTAATGLLYGGIGLSIAATTPLLFDFDLGVFRDHRPARLDGIAIYIVMALAITLMVGGIFSTLISASIGAASVGFLALLGIVALVNIVGLGGSGHRAQWRSGAVA